MNKNPLKVQITQYNVLQSSLIKQIFFHVKIALKAVVEDDIW